jgi:tetratricopeptide (TPR) repeat protein
MKKLILIALLFTLQPTFACLNEIRVLLNGKITISDEESPVPYGQNYHESRSKIETKLKEVYKDWIEKKNLDDYSDYGVLLVYLGEYEKALKVYENIEMIMPGLYTTAANIGTIYELLGKNELAYKWIEKAISIDSKSHYGSEWLHLKILQVKMNQKPLTTSFFLGTEFGNDVIPKSILEKDKLEKLKYQIYYQLDERVSFIKPKDEIVALLLFELGNICAITDDATSAYRVYKKAKEYGYNSELFERRFSFVEKLQVSLDKKLKEQNRQKEYLIDYKLLAIIITVIIFITVSILILRKRKRIS